MVCEKCCRPSPPFRSNLIKGQKKLGALITPEVWKEGSRESLAGGRKATNTLLSKKRSERANPYSSKCKICKSKLHQTGYYCHDCAYKKGICSMCGRKILDTSGYKQSMT
eukprot:TRINITY_DN2678_c0_g1_i3.p1 TRINITY_DN2678_c0_g1~~TRINITY_DN2678_c0_g1_i3.p1  ORF type:complete len:110 (+),score=17.61 TRINITY_DN2678_c0_g1_i3:162-491(+)